MTNMIVRLAQQQDLDRLAEIERESMANPWSKDQFAAEFENEYAYLLCAEMDGVIVGLCDIHIVPGDAHINEIAVGKEYRRKGVGAALIEEACNLARQHDCKSVTLEVRSSSREGRKFYEELGFKRIGEKWNYYRDPSDDALVLQKEI